LESIISKQESEHIIESEKFIESSFEWKKDSNRDYVFEFRIPIKTSISGIKLFMKGSVNVALSRTTFALICNNAARIKALDIGGREHPNRCPNHKIEWIGSKHKHSWQDCCGDKWAYVPDDITDNAPVEQTFWEFLDECNIRYDGEFPKIPSMQTGLIFDELFDDIRVSR
jgi:hypothetical protein